MPLGALRHGASARVGAAGAARGRLVRASLELGDRVDTSRLTKTDFLKASI